MTTQLIEDRYTELHSAFQTIDQAHVFTFWPKLDGPSRQQLLDDLAQVNLDGLPACVELVTGATGTTVPSATIEAAEVVSRESVGDDIIQHGRDLLTAGKVAAFTVAGGQGTRLGFDGPKGAFRISPVKNKPLFRLFAESILGTDRTYGCRTQWYIMTSPANDQATRDFFRENTWFGLAEDQVSFFQQGVMPAFSRKGKILLDQQHRLALSPDGHGGSLLALATTGMLADMARRGIEQISYFQVDNPLVMCLDPVFIGLHAKRGADMSSKAVSKADDLERVGNFAMADGRQIVIEYSDLPDELAHAKNSDGSRRFDAGNIAIHMLSRAFVERLTVDHAAFALPWHLANKKVPYIDLDSGTRIEPDEPNATKLEAFVFDALPLANHPIILETSRLEEFSPVKNASGVDSVETARRDMNRRAARWLGAAGCEIPTTPEGEPDGTFEITGLAAVEPAQVRDRVSGRAAITPGIQFYMDA